MINISVLNKMRFTLILKVEFFILVGVEDDCVAFRSFDVFLRV